jgi:hypothetical protein
MENRRLDLADQQCTPFTFGTTNDGMTIHTGPKRNPAFAAAHVRLEGQTKRSAETALM